MVPKLYPVIIQMSDFSHRTLRRTDLLVFMNLGYNYNFIHTKNKKFVKKKKKLTNNKSWADILTE